MFRKTAQGVAYALANRLLSGFDPRAPLILAFGAIPDEATFESWMAALQGLGRPVVSVDQIAEPLRSGNTALPGAVALTFDDCFQSQLEWAVPALERRGWPATFYAVTGYLGRDADWPEPGSTSSESRLMTGAEVHGLARSGFAVGCHTVGHLYLPYLREEHLRQEVEMAKAALQDLIGSAVTSFSYPFGRFDAESRRAVAACDFSDAVTTVERPVAAGDDPYLLPRVLVPDRAVAPSRFLAHLHGTFRPFQRLVRWLPT